MPKNNKMTRFLYLPLLLVLVMPTFAVFQTVAQEGQVTGQLSPNDLIRMREELNFRLQETQQMLRFVNPMDTQHIEQLHADQAELTQKLREVLHQQMQPPAVHGAARNPSQMPGMPNMMNAMPNAMQPHHQAFQHVPSQSISSPWQMPTNRNLDSPFPTMPTMPITPHPIGVQPFGVMPPETRMLQELSAMRQSVDSLQREVGELRETIKVLETQIQLLNRNFLLNERLRDNDRVVP
jgi:hypothetical protein